jgi:hypothetical protein
MSTKLTVTEQEQRTINGWSILYDSSYGGVIAVPVEWDSEFYTPMLKATLHSVFLKFYEGPTTSMMLNDHLQTIEGAALHVDPDEASVMLQRSEEIALDFAEQLCDLLEAVVDENVTVEGEGLEITVRLLDRNTTLVAEVACPSEEELNGDPNKQQLRRLPDEDITRFFARGPMTPQQTARLIMRNIDAMRNVD